MSKKTALAATHALVREREAPVVAVTAPEDPEEVAAPRDWFAGAVPGTRPAFRGQSKIGMG